MSAQAPTSEQSNGALSEWQGVAVPTVAAPGPWKIALTTSVLSAVTGWVLDGVSRSVRSRRRQR